MNKKSFRKTLSANDVGATGGHQAGILIPKTELELLAFLPYLDPGVKNPDAWIECIDKDGNTHQFRFVYYNNKLHDPHGTRNEYRVTYMTKYFRVMAAHEGDIFEISRNSDAVQYKISVLKPEQETVIPDGEKILRIKITASWRRVH
jgi:hypothetical protein